MEEKWKDFGVAIGALAALIVIGVSIFNLPLDFSIKLFLVNLVLIILVIIYVNLNFEKKKA